MSSIKQKICFFLVFSLILSVIYTPDMTVYTATTIQLKTTLNNFDDNDNIQSVNQITPINSTSTFNDIHISTPIEISFRNNTSNLNIIGGGTLSSFMTLTKNTDTTSTNLIGSSADSIITDANPANFTKVTLNHISGKSFEPDSTYTLKINLGKLQNADGSSLSFSGNGIYTIVLNTEKTPKVTHSIINNKIILTFDRKINVAQVNSYALNNNILFKDEALGDSATLLSLSQVATSITANANQTNSKTSTVTINGVKNASYTIVLNSDALTPTFSRQLLSGTTNPGITSASNINVSETTIKNVAVNFQSQTISKNIKIKKSDTETLSNISLSNSQSSSNSNIDIDALQYGNKLLIDMDVSSSKKLIQNPQSYTNSDSAHADSPITISDSTSAIGLVINQIKSNPTGEFDILELSGIAPLKANTKYTLTIHKDKFLFNGDSTMPAGSISDKELYTFTTESAPEFTALTPVTLRQDSENRTVTLTSSRPIEKMTASSLKDVITISNGPLTIPVIESAKLVNDTTLELTLGSLTNSLGDYTLTIPQGTFKRKGSSSLSSLEYTNTFKVTRQEDFLKISSLDIKNFSDDDINMSAANQTNLPTVTGNSNNFSTSINKVYIATPVRIVLNTSVKAASSKSIDDILKLYELGDDIKISEYYNVISPTPSQLSSSFNTIELIPKKALKADTRYVLSIDNSQMLDANYSVSLGDTKFNIALNTENRPSATQGSEVNVTYTATFDRKIDPVSASNIELLHFVSDNFGGAYKKYTDPINLSLSSDSKTLSITSLPKGLYKIKLKDINRIGSTNLISTLSAADFESSFEIKSLSDNISRNISLSKADTNQSVNVNKKGESNSANIDIDVDSQIKVKFDIPYSYTSDAFILKKSNSLSSINTNITNNFISGVIDGVNIIPASPLEANTKYTLILDKSKFTDRQGSIAGLSGETEEYEFTTEIAPILTLETKKLEKGQEAKLTVTSSKNIEPALSADLKSLISIKDKNSNPINVSSATLINKNTINIVLEDISSNSVALGDAEIYIADTVFKREGSTSLKTNELSDTFSISRDNNYIKADITTSVFTSSDKLNTSYTNTNISASSTHNIDNMYVGSNINIKLNDTLTSAKSIYDILKFSENSSNLDISDYYSINPQNLSSPFDTIILTPKKALNPNSSYTLSLDTSSLKESTHGTDIGNSNFIFVFNTEKKPVGTQGNQVNKTFSVTFTRKIDTPNKNDINLFKMNDYGQFAEFNDFSNSDISLENDSKTLNISNLPYGQYKIWLNVGEEKIKRISSETNHDVYAQAFNGAVSDESKPDFEIKNLADTVSDYIRVKKYAESASQTVQINKIGESNSNNTEIETNTSINIKFTIPYTYSNDSFAIAAATSNISSPSIKSISRVTSQTGATDGVNIELDDVLEPNAKYKLILYKDKFINSQGSLAGNNGEIEEYEFTTELSPKIISSDIPKMEQKSADQNIVIRFDKNIELVDSSKITIDKTTAFSSVNVSDNTLTLEVNSSLANTISTGEHNIHIAPSSIKRIGSSNVYVSEQLISLSVVEDQAKKAQEEAEKKAEEEAKKALQEQIEASQAERNAYRLAVANALADEMQKRYQAEYGSDYDFNSFNDYIKDKYIKEKGTLYSGLDYIQAYLIDYGYVDDFISKYGRNSKDISEYAKDYLNRYGSFAYSDREKYDNPFFMNPFRDSSSKRGYYDYYNLYDYGYRYPEMRVGDDNISLANLEKEEKLKQKEAELIAKERGYAIKTGQNYSPTAINSPKIIINQGSRYFIYEDQYGNRTSVDMGVEPVVSNGRLFVAITPLSNKLGLWVNYDSATKTATISKPNTTSAISPNSSYITINGVSENMGIRPIMRNGKMMIPAHYMAKAFGLDSSNIVIENTTITINNY